MSYRGDPANIGIPELESVRRLREGAVRLPDGSGFFVGTVGKKKRKRESVEGGPGSGPRSGKGKSPYGKKPSQLDALRGDKPPKTLKDHVKRLADEVSDGPGDDFKDKLRVAMSQARSEGNSRAVAAIQHLRNADDYNSKGLQRGSDRMMDKADAMYDKGISMLRKSV